MDINENSVIPQFTQPADPAQEKPESKAEFKVKLPDFSKSKSKFKLPDFGGKTDIKLVLSVICLVIAFIAVLCGITGNGDYHNTKGYVKTAAKYNGIKLISVDEAWSKTFTYKDENSVKHKVDKGVYSSKITVDEIDFYVVTEASCSDGEYGYNIVFVSKSKDEMTNYIKDYKALLKDSKKVIEYLSLQQYYGVNTTEMFDKLKLTTADTENFTSEKAAINSKYYAFTSGIPVSFDDFDAEYLSTILTVNSETAEILTSAQ